MTKQTIENSTVHHLAGRDVHIHYGTDPEALTDTQRWQYRTTLLQYRQTLPKFHQLLCQHAQLRFNTAKLVELDDKQLTELFEFHQAVVMVGGQLRTSIWEKWRVWLKKAFRKEK